MQPDPARMKRIQELLSPGKHHAEMRYFEGEWEVKMRTSMPGPDGKVQESAPETLRATFEWVIPGRWMSERLQGSMMGRPYQGFLLHGYDTFTKNFVSAMVSNMDPSMNVFRGAVVDPTGKVTTQYGTINEWLDDTVKPVKTLVRKVDDDHFECEVWDLQIGPTGHPVLKFAYTRAAK